MSPSEKPIPIRPHHGMCLAYYVGHGYSEGFNWHMGRMLERFLRNPAVRLTVARDEICSACPNARGEGCTADEKVQRYDRAVLAACGLEEGTELPFLDFARQVEEHILAVGLREQICGDCQWTELCRGPGRWKEQLTS
ncbi:MAG: DUF1284 domain-containing protein [Oscillospiraceae bacterium]|nr:DUF1284 domain-containing protein [Oscillospiraceae bacterium]MBR1845156.1 DUF1284 domain-containing protein [Oscillospiraceae bacterium]